MSKVIDIGAPMTYRRGWAEQEYRLAIEVLRKIRKKPVAKWGEQYRAATERRDAALNYIFMAQAVA